MSDLSPDNHTDRQAGFGEMMKNAPQFKVSEAADARIKETIALMQRKAVVADVQTEGHSAWSWLWFLKPVMAVLVISVLAVGAYVSLSDRGSTQVAIHPGAEVRQADSEKAYEVHLASAEIGLSELRQVLSNVSTVGWIPVARAGVETDLEIKTLTAQIVSDVERAIELIEDEKDATALEKALNRVRLVQQESVTVFVAAVQVAKEPDTVVTVAEAIDMTVERNRAVDEQIAVVRAAAAKNLPIPTVDIATTEDTFNESFAARISKSDVLEQRKLDREGRLATQLEKTKEAIQVFKEADVRTPEVDKLSERVTVIEHALEAGDTTTAIGIGAVTHLELTDQEQSLEEATKRLNDRKAVPPAGFEEEIKVKPTPAKPTIQESVKKPVEKPVEPVLQKPVVQEPPAGFEGEIKTIPKPDVTNTPTPVIPRVEVPPAGFEEEVITAPLP
ncbi:hypothetical protein IPJ72_07110 [Candidatus Peregrinibacteria bacterium]|nr:MAG: hypothetical protein IPJ72_07110 [Candidatus Peregrinibacteria bacterium]